MCQRDSPVYRQTIAPFQYANPLAGLIQSFKYRRRITLARPLGQLLATEIRSKMVVRPELIVPVPLHWTRLMTRGFNQSLEVAKQLSTILAVPFAYRYAIKFKRTPTQASLPLSHRRHNVSGCFRVKSACGIRSVAIVDDVVTSGETVNSLALELANNGVTDIQVWAVART